MGHLTTHDLLDQLEMMVVESKLVIIHYAQRSLKIYVLENMVGFLIPRVSQVFPSDPILILIQFFIKEENSSLCIDELLPFLFTSMYPIQKGD